MSAPATGQLPKKFSPTALGMYEECPKQFEFAYLLRPEIEEVLSPHLVLGNAVHAALAFVYRLPVEQRTEVALHQALRHHWALISDRSGRPPDQLLSPDRARANRRASLALNLVARASSCSGPRATQPRTPC